MMSERRVCILSSNGPGRDTTSPNCITIRAAQNGGGAQGYPRRMMSKCRNMASAGNTASRPSPGVIEMILEVVCRAVVGKASQRPRQGTPEQASVRHSVVGTNEFSKRNPHCEAQCRHLFPSRYINHTPCSSEYHSSALSGTSEEAKWINVWVQVLRFVVDRARGPCRSCCQDG